MTKPPQFVPGPDAPLREQLAALLVVRIGSNMRPFPTVEDDAPRVRGLLAELPLGGLAVFNGHAQRTPETLAVLQRETAYPLLIGSDIERGVGQQFAGLTLFPHALAFDALGADAAAAVHEFALLTARQARAHGLHVTFGPLADIHANPRNPIIATRALGTTAERVAELAAAYVRGCHDGGLLATAKHFPGHGNTHEDSHDALPTVDADRAALDAHELAPFRAAIAAGVDLVMTAHVRYPALDPSGAAATCSAPIVAQVLKGELGFRGAVITDSLLMAGARGQYAHEGELALASVQAGVDLLLDVADPIGVVDFLTQCVEQNRLPLARVRDALERIAAVKQASWQNSADATYADDDLDQAIARAARTVAEGAIVVSPEKGKTIALARSRPLTAILLRPHTTHRDPPQQPMAAELRRFFPQVEYHEVTQATAAEDWTRIDRAAHIADQLLVAFIVKPAAWQQFGLPEAWEAWLRSVLERRPVTLACLGAPEGLAPFPYASARLCSYSDVPLSQAAVAARVAGEGGVGQPRRSDDAGAAGAP